MICTGANVITINLKVKSFTCAESSCDTVTVKLCSEAPFIRYGDAIIDTSPRTFFVMDDDGQVVNEDNEEMDLMETDTMTTDSGEDVFYEITALSGGFRKLFTVPANSTSPIDFFDLPEYIPS